MNTATVTLKNRTYTFSTDEAEKRHAVSTVGTLTNSRGQFAGYVVRLEATGTLSMMFGPKVSRNEERSAMDDLAAALAAEVV